QSLAEVKGADGAWFTVDALAVKRSGRWIVDDAHRARYESLHEQLSAAMAQPRVALRFSDGTLVEVRPRPRGLSSLPPTLWLFAALGLALYLLGAIVLLSRPSARNLLYAVMAG